MPPKIMWTKQLKMNSSSSSSLELLPVAVDKMDDMQTMEMARRRLFREATQKGNGRTVTSGHKADGIASAPWSSMAAVEHTEGGMVGKGTKLEESTMPR